MGRRKQDGRDGEQGSGEMGIREAERRGEETFVLRLLELHLRLLPLLSPLVQLGDHTRRPLVKAREGNEGGNGGKGEMEGEKKESG